MSSNSSMPSSGKSIIVRYLFTLAFLTSSFLYGITTAQNNEMACPEEYQENAIDKLWICPALPNFNSGGDYTLTHELTDVNFKTGGYTCVYRYKSSGNSAQSCRFKSGAYEKMQQDIQDELYGVQADGSVTTGVFKLLDHPNYSPSNEIVLNTLFNKIGVTAPDYLVTNIQPEINDVHRKIKDSMLSMDDKTKNSLQEVEAHLKDLRSISYKHLVEPYYSPNVKDALKKEGTFSNFLAGLVTLNGDIVEGYNEDTGELIINTEWKNKATSISATETGLLTTIKSATSTVTNYIADFFSSGAISPESEALRKESALDAPDGSEYMLAVSSWVDIFEMKLWGYYYNLQRRLDLGYDVISTQLLYIMSMWFILLAGTKTGIGHIINREQGVKVTEDNWMKGLAMMVGLGVFFISLPSPITSTNVEGQGSEITQEMHKNKTIMKYIIRESAEQGANFATMLSDLGLDAFLSFVVKKQHIYSINEVRRSFQDSVAEMAIYYPAYSIVEQCRAYYGTSDADFYNASSPTSLNVVPSWENSTYATSNNISSLSYNLCRKAYTIVGVTPHDMYLTVAETRERIDNIDEIMAKAVHQLITNHILAQDKMGWVNTFNAPVTYFVMKYGDMFLSDGIDYNKVEAEAKKMVKTLGVKDGEAISTSDAVGGWNTMRVLWGGTQDAIQGGSASFISWVSHFAMYNVLPGFSAMQQGIQGHFDKVYGDMLEIHLDGSASNSSVSSQIGQKFTDLIGSIKSLVSRLPASSILLKTISFAIPDIESSFAWRSLLLLVSFLLAIYAWSLMFKVVFISTVAIMLLLKTVLYFKDLMIHVITSIFVVVWAFAKQGGQGEAKMVGFMRDTLVLMIYPSIIVLSAYTFIFIFELFTVVYTYLMTIMLEGQKATVSLMTVANSNTDTFTSYMNLNAIGYMSEILVNVFGLFIAIITIMQMPEYILKKLGINENETMMMSANSEKVSQRGEKFSNPL